MIRGTTPQHVFSTPLLASEVKTVRITYEQSGSMLVEKTEADCTITDNSISVQLTQEETLRFEELKTYSAQIRVLTTAGEALTSNIVSDTVERTLNEEVLE